MMVSSQLRSLGCCGKTRVVSAKEKVPILFWAAVGD